MKIVPKYGTDRWAPPTGLIPYVSDTVELHMLRWDAKTCLRCFHSLREYDTIMHMPMGFHNIETIPYFYPTILEFIEQLAKCPHPSHVLFHSGLSGKEAKSLRLYKTVEPLLHAVEKTNGHVRLLLENSIQSPNYIGDQAYDYLMDNIPNELMGACFDLCHHTISQNLYGEHAYFNHFDRVYSVHFSTILNNDGFLDMSTHAAPHANVNEVKADLQRLVDFGLNLDKVLLVPEVLEKDYTEHLNEVRELEMLSEVLKDGSYP